MTTPREIVVEWIRENPGRTYKSVSKELGKNETYLQQFVKNNKPARLPEDVRFRLAELMGIDEQLLRDGAAAKIPLTKTRISGESIIVSEHDVRASAGGGSLIEQETERAQWPLPRDYVRHTLSLSTNELSIVEVIGDSMTPTLHSGDKILIDRSDKSIAMPGIFALHDGDGTVVKRVEKIPASEPPRVALISDNPHHGRYEVPAEMVSVIGRVVWFGRRL